MLPGNPGTDGTPPGQLSERCVGVAIQAHNMDDSTSCIFQGGRWSSDLQACRGVDRSCGGRFDMETCLQVAGCEWEANGGRTSHPRAGGTCEGNAYPCRLLSRDDCER